MPSARPLSWCKQGADSDPRNSQSKTLGSETILLSLAVISRESGKFDEGTVVMEDIFEAVRSQQPNDQ